MVYKFFLINADAAIKRAQLRNNHFLKNCLTSAFQSINFRKVYLTVGYVRLHRLKSFYMSFFTVIHAIGDMWKKLQRENEHQRD